jgi:hypothetical protein
MAADDSNPQAHRRSHDLASLRASIVRLPDSRPKSGRTPDKRQVPERELLSTARRARHSQ